MPIIFGEKDKIFDVKKFTLSRLEICMALIRSFGVFSKSTQKVALSLWANNNLQNQKMDCCKSLQSFDP